MVAQGIGEATIVSPQAAHSAALVSDVGAEYVRSDWANAT